MTTIGVIEGDTRSLDYSSYLAGLNTTSLTHHHSLVLNSATPFSQFGLGLRALAKDDG